METYDSLNAKLLGQCAGSRKLANHTYAVRLEKDKPTGLIGIRLHDTYILTYTPVGSVVVTSGGWHTVTTKERLNRYLPYGWGVYQRDSLWYVWHRGIAGGDVEYPFVDGMEIWNDKIEYPDDSIMLSPRELASLQRNIRKYTANYVAALFAGDVPAPSKEDCWYCRMQTMEGQTLAEASNNTEHLQSHMDERYYVPSLLSRAIDVFPVSQASMWTLGDVWGGGDGLAKNCFRTIAAKQLRGSLRRYLYRQFGFAA